VDWAAAGKVSVIKDQGQCGSSWAFGATGAIESAYMIKGTNILVSEQEIMDCSTDYGNQGCNGGYMSAALKFVKERKVHEEKDYPYLAKFQKCLKPSGPTWGLSNYVDVVGCNNLINAVTIGPVAIAVDASNFSTYKSGILNKCGNTANHGSLVVGVTDTYWKLKEAWGANWGEKGFIRIPPGNSCAVCDIPSYPIV
jgi:C1A family cysteine protease